MSTPEERSDDLRRELPTPRKHPADPDYREEEEPVTGELLAPSWRKVSDGLPPCKWVLAAYKNSHDKWRVVRACYYPARHTEAVCDSDVEGGSEYDEATDTYWVAEGWYEENDHEDTSWMIDERVTHWMPLPAPPEEE